ncbi:coiled-coil domain-containing protein 89-like isoform X1 [Xyrauchen texanus]|uniref:coiled-coil domain-containing protein 89-like isoform X1 n=2 Tax=Xyrauchen texanus TaxID=154827 RepID=UPI0022420E94|nr:coiled-coil domain-containing protein 89-like isoform X1 [Xyrauchen texanus]
MAAYFQIASPTKNPIDLKTMIKDTKQDMDDVHQALEKLRSLSHEERTEGDVLHSRIDEQSSLICILKHRADEMLLRCQALENINSELENLRANVQVELENERKKSEQLEQRFMDLAANHKELINFKDEYKSQNAKLTKENEGLREENDNLFSKELQEKEEIILKLTQELKDLAKQHKRFETEYQKKTTGFQIKLKELMNLHQIKEASLKNELNDAQKQLKNAVEMCAELDLRLRQTQEKETMRDTETRERLDNLMKENNELIDLSLQRGKIIQDKQTEILELERKRQEAESGRLDAEHRFEKEAAAVNSELKVKELQYGLERAEDTCNELKKEFEAYKKHSSELLEKEKELNCKLRHLII